MHAKSKRITTVRFPNGETYSNDRGLWTDCIAAGRAEALYGKEGADALHEYRRKELLALISVKATLTVVCTHRGRSGTNRYRVYLPTIRDGKPYITEVTARIAEFVGLRQANGEIVMSGYDYSKSFQIGYSLGCALWPTGTPEPHGERNGKPDSHGGFAIGVA